MKLLKMKDLGEQQRKGKKLAWTGKWSKNDHNTWNMALKEKLGYDQAYESGHFFISLEDFVCMFNSTTIVSFDQKLQKSVLEFQVMTHTD